MTTYSYTKTPVSVDRLTQEIQQSSISVALDHINLFGAALDINFRADISEDEKATLDGIVSAHAGLPLPQNEAQNVVVQNQPNISILNAPPYGSKNVTINGVTKKLFARFTGLQFDVVEGDNTLTWTVPYAWAKILGVEVVNCEALDTASLKVYDTAQGTYSGVPNLLLNQFSFSLNLPKDFYQRMAQFDADLYQGLVVSISYNSKSAKTVGINLLLDEVKS